MPMTRHLYELDEVVSALQLCLRKNWPRALFWVWELVVSEEETLAHDTLRTAWLLYGGGHDPALLTMNPCESDEWIRYTLRTQAAIKAAGSLHALRLLRETAALTEPPAGPPRQPLPPPRCAFTLSADEELDADTATRWLGRLRAACNEGRRMEAMWLIQVAQPVLSADAIWTALTTLSARVSPFRDAASPHPESQILHQANAVLLLCMSGEEVPADVTEAQTSSIFLQRRSWDTWMSQRGRRTARVHEIPSDALHAGTTRGRMEFKYTNILDVRDPVSVLTEGCAWWRRTLQQFGATVEEETGALTFPTDDALEEFYAMCFPDDIPDEWSAADQQKSHGRGVRNPAPLPDSVAIREEPLRALSGIL